MKRYEYNTYICRDLDLDIDELDKLGAEGWELVSTSAICDSSDAVTLYHYFKREL